MVGVLRTSPTPLSRMHRLQLPNLPTTIQVLERKSVLHPILSPQTLLTHTAGCSDPEDLIRADASIKFATSADVIADALIMLLPLNLLRKLQVSAQQKLGLAVIFSLGTIIIAFAFARLAQVTKATSNPDPATLADGPVLLSMWSHIESSVPVIVATLPAFWFLLSGKIGRTRAGPSKPPVYGSAEPASEGARSKARRGYSTHRWSRNTATRLPSSEQDRKGSYDWCSETELRPMAGEGTQIDHSVERGSVIT